MFYIDNATFMSVYFDVYIIPKAVGLFTIEVNPFSGLQTVVGSRYFDLEISKIT